MGGSVMFDVKGALLMATGTDAAGAPTRACRSATVRAVASATCRLRISVVMESGAVAVVMG